MNNGCYEIAWIFCEPILKDSMSVFTKDRISSALDFGKYTLDAALHFWPWYSNAPRLIAVATCLACAEGWATIKSFPPVSPTITWIRFITTNIGSNFSPKVVENIR